MCVRYNTIAEYLPLQFSQAFFQRECSVIVQQETRQNANLFAACEVDKVQLAAQFLLCFNVFLFDVDEKDRVTARRMLIHVYTTSNKASVFDLLLNPQRTI